MRDDFQWSKWQENRPYFLYCKKQQEKHRRQFAKHIKELIWCKILRGDNTDAKWAKRTV